MAAAFWLLVWQCAYIYVGKDVLVVSPFRAFQRLAELSGEAQFWLSVGLTCARVVGGFFAALAAGGVLALLTARFTIFRRLFAPPLGVIQATPIASFIILALIWISSGKLPVFISFLMVLPVVWVNLSAGISGVDKELLEVAHIFHFTRLKRFRLIYFPAVMPHFIAACSTGLGFAWKSAISAEVICHPRYSVGSGIYDSKVYLETADLFAWTIAVIILSVLLEKTTVRLLRRLEQCLLVSGAVRGRGISDAR